MDHGAMRICNVIPRIAAQQSIIPALKICAIAIGDSIERRLRDVSEIQIRQGAILHEFSIAIHILTRNDLVNNFTAVLSRLQPIT
jgi:hypothetical protein